MSKLRLRSTLRGHEKDVRAIVGTDTPQGAIISGSRDVTTRLWAPNEDDPGFHEAHVMSGHNNYVASVCVMKPDEKYPHGLIITGSNDHSILAFSLESPTPIYKLEGHTGTVCALSAGNHGTLLSGSWDTTAKVWLNEKNVMTLKGHDNSVWAVLVIPEGGVMVTGSADKTIKLWKAGQCIQTLTGHTDCVRGLCCVGTREFLSCANDATIRRWSLTGDCIQIYEGHTNYIYGITSNASRFFTCGEDRTLKMWSCDEGLEQSVTLPATSVWCVTCLSNSDVAVGCSDGTVRVFTLSEERAAVGEEQEAFNTELSSSSIPTQLGDIKTEQLPGPEALLRQGTREGQTLMVRRGTAIECHQWSSADGRWVKVGDVVGASGGSSGTSGKQMFEGKEYDYVFDVDLDGHPGLKLPYNSGEDPWMAAQNFIHKHELNQLFLDQIANFITSQTGVPTVGSSVGNVDPFTGGSSYRSGEASSNPVQMEVGQSDPFTGAGRYVPDQRADDKVEVKSKYFPHLSCLTFDAGKIDTIIGKLEEFSGLEPADQQLSAEGVTALRQIASGSGLNSTGLTAISRVLAWSAEHSFAGIDLLRLSVRHESMCSKLAAPLLTAALIHLPSSQVGAAQLVSARAVANLLAYPSGMDVVVSRCDEVADALVSAAACSLSKPAEIAMSTVLLNLSVAVNHCTLAASLAVAVVRVAAALIPTLTDSEAQFRALVAVGNVCKNEMSRDAATELQLRQVVWAVVQQPEKVAQCRQDLLSVL